jgi:hypothetical protein
MCAVLQGFPKDWVFSGGKTAAYRQVGNAFPPPVAAAAGQAHQISSSSSRQDCPGCMSHSLLTELRTAFHAGLFESALSRGTNGVWSNADTGNVPSCNIAEGIAMHLKSEVQDATKSAGQTLGNKFEHAVNGFVQASFSHLAHLRPGRWLFLPVLSHSGKKTVKKAEVGISLSISDFEQFAHLKTLDKIAANNPEVALALGNSYIFRPDIVIARWPEDDQRINEPENVVDSEIAQKTSLRKSNNSVPILHASVSCKWTLRTDRAQNARTEALNLIRNRKGRVPHIVVVTAEPLPSRLASLALGTGDIDCVYHFALRELQETVASLRMEEEAKQMLNNLVDGLRLKDISDLSLDLAI